MARLGHRQPNTSSHIRRPVVVGPIEIIPRMKVTLAVQATRRRYPPQVVNRSVRFTPVVVGAALVVPPIKTTLAAHKTRRRYPPQAVTKSFFRKPAVIQAAIVPDGISATSDFGATVSVLRGVTPAAINATSSISATVATQGAPSPRASTIEVSLAGRRHSGHSRFHPPSAIDAPIQTFSPTTVTLKTTLNAVGTSVAMRSRDVFYRFNPPTVVNPATGVAPIRDQLVLRTKIAKQPKRYPARYGGINPAIINPIVMLPVQQELRTTTVAVATRRDLRRRNTRCFFTKAQAAPSTVIVASATINATSTVSAAITRTIPITAAINATSTVTGAVVRIVPIVPAAINATSNVVASVTGGTGGAAHKYYSSPAPAMLYVMGNGGPLA